METTVCPESESAMWGQIYEAVVVISLHAGCLSGIIQIQYTRKHCVCKESSNR